MKLISDEKRIELANHCNNIINDAKELKALLTYKDYHGTDIIELNQTRFIADIECIKTAISIIEQEVKE